MNKRCLIVEDEHLARELLKAYCAKIPGLEVVRECKNAIEAMQVLQNESVDIIFLDVQMPELSGIEFAKTLDPKPAIIFTTAYSDYAVNGFELEATDYLLKPIAFDRFIRAVNKVGGKKEQSQESDFITLKADHKLYKVKYEGISHIEGLREYVAFHTDQKKIVALESLKKLEEILPSHFKRVHKSFIVNTERILSISGNEIELEGFKIPVGKSYKEEVLKLF